MGKSPKPDTSAVYVAWKSFAAAEFDGVAKRGDRLRGDHPAVVNHPEFFLPAATPSDDMPNELAYERDPEPELPGRVLMRVIGPRTVCLVDGLRYETGAQFEAEGIDAKRFVELGVAEIVHKLRPKRPKPIPEPEPPTGLTSGDLQ